MPRKAFPTTSKTLGDRIQTKRIEQGLLQSEVAQMLGVKTLLVKQWEENLQTPAEAEWAVLAKLLNLSDRNEFSIPFTRSNLPETQ